MNINGSLHWFSHSVFLRARKNPVLQNDSLRLTELSQLFTPGDRCIFPLGPLQKPKEMGLGAFFPLGKSRQFLGRRSISVCVCMFPACCAYHLWWLVFRSILFAVSCDVSLSVMFERIHPTIQDIIIVCHISVTCLITSKSYYKSYIVLS
jgi:hypothetical protein